MTVYVVTIFYATTYRVYRVTDFTAVIWCQLVTDKGVDLAEMFGVVISIRYRDADEFQTLTRPLACTVTNTR